MRSIVEKSLTPEHLRANMNQVMAVMLLNICQKVIHSKFEKEFLIAFYSLSLSKNHQMVNPVYLFRKSPKKWPQLCNSVKSTLSAADSWKKVGVACNTTKWQCLAANKMKKKI